jgi:chitinase
MASKSTFFRLFWIATLALAVTVNATEIMRRPAGYKNTPNKFATEKNPNTTVIHRRQSGGKVSVGYFTNWGIYGANFRMYFPVSVGLFSTNTSSAPC